MAEINVKAKARRRFKVSHRGRLAQVGIYLWKLLRMFVYQNDWKVLPMAALIAGLVGMVIRRRLFITMEGTLMGAFAMVCVCIWNGCFNSIQVICRERDVIKREHRSGMHISSYIVSHMLYQALLCLLQTAVTLYVTALVGVKYPAEGLFTRWMIVDYGISMFLITYASDMMSLWISSLARTTTAAMTIMPFVLIFQLVFSGGMLSLPAWTDYITPFTISNPGLKVLTAQADYNVRPLATIWDQVQKMADKEVSATVTMGQVLDLLGNGDIPSIAQLREKSLDRLFTLGDLKAALDTSESYRAMKAQRLAESEGFQSLLKSLLDEDTYQPILAQVTDSDTTVGDVLEAVGFEETLAENAEVAVGADTTIGALVDQMAANPSVQPHLKDAYTFKSTVRDIIDMIGQDKVKDVLQTRIGEASRNADYENTRENIVDYWFSLFVFVLAFAALSTITLEFIDKDKR